PDREDGARVAERGDRERPEEEARHDLRVRALEVGQGRIEVRHERRAAGQVVEAGGEALKTSSVQPPPRMAMSVRPTVSTVAPTSPVRQRYSIWPKSRPITVRTMTPSCVFGCDSSTVAMMPTNAPATSNR